MSASFHSVDDVWSKLANLRPHLRKHIRVHMHTYRAQQWYVLQDQLTAEHLRLNTRAYAVIGRLDGSVSIDTVYNYLRSEHYPDLTKSEVIETISHLQDMGAISNVIDKTTVELVDSYTAKNKGLSLRKLLNPLLIRIPLLDPDALLNKITPKLRHVFSAVGIGVWLLFVVPTLLLVFQYSGELGSALRYDIFSASNLLLLWLLYPIMKLIHEFAHAICIKHWGGEVHEMGITLLVLTPIPYVDASAATAFKSKHKRMLVSAAGILIELFLAFIALFYWVNASDGLSRDLAFGVFTIGAVSTVLFNANPLLKFDGYYILQDYIEIPNLASRSMKYYKYLFKRYVLKLDDQVSPVTVAGERRWFLSYGAASSVYRLFVLFVIVGFLSAKYLLLGTLLGLWVVFQQLLMPLFRSIKYLLYSPEVKQQPNRSRYWVLASAVGGAVLIGVLPLPSSTKAQGVVWVPQQGEMYAESAGFVKEVLVAPGEQVQVGQLLLELESPELEKSLIVAQNELRILDVQSELHRTTNAAEYSYVKQDTAALERSVQELELQMANLRLYAQTAGVFTPTDLTKLQGQYFAQGDLIAHVVNPSELVVRVAVPDSNSGRLQEESLTATVKLAEALDQRLVAKLINEVPAANRKLPSAALGTAGGGGIAIASDDPNGVTTVENVFHLQLGLPRDTTIFGVGERAYVTLRHKAEPLGTRWLRSLQQVFLKTLPT